MSHNIILEEQCEDTKSNISN